MAVDLGESVASILPRHVGACVLVIDDGQIVLERGYGVTDLKTNHPCTPVTNFRLASVTKQFIAAAVLLLQDRGKLSVDDPLPKYFADFPEYGRHITLRHLLTHTSGIPDYESLIPTGTTLQLHDLEVLDLLMDTQEPLFPAGSRFQYSNSGYVLLGLIVEEVAERPLQGFLKQTIFQPLGMNDTVLFVRGMNRVSNRAWGHSWVDGSWSQTDQSTTSAVRGDGGIYSSLRDLTRWLRALDDRQLLSPAAYEAMFTPAVATDRGLSHYGYGWFIDTHRGEPRISHEGGTRGFSLALHRYPRRRAAVVVLINNEIEPNIRDVGTQIADLALFRDDRAPVPPQP